MPLPASLLFANALGPLFPPGGRTLHAHAPLLPPPFCRRAAGEASSSSPSFYSSSRHRCRCPVAAKASSSTPPPQNARSFDGEDELDSLVAAELAQYIDPERAKQEQKRLELAWAVRAKVRFTYLTTRRIGTSRGAFSRSIFSSVSTASLSPSPSLSPKKKKNTL